MSKYLIQRITVENGKFAPEVVAVETVGIVEAELDKAQQIAKQIATANLDAQFGRTMLWIQHGGSVTVGLVSTANMEMPTKSTQAIYYSVTELSEAT